MKELQLKELQDLELDMMKRFHHVCKEHGLRYSLIYGTLLGAVRHQGFIPWDDDIDVMMPRDDYTKLLALGSSVFEENYYTLRCYEQDEDYIHPIAKMVDERTVLKEITNIDSVKPLGVYIDIFPVDKIPDDLHERTNFHVKCCKNARNLAFASLRYYPTSSILKNIIKKCVLQYYHVRGAKPYIKKLKSLIAYSASLSSNIVKIIAFPEDKHNEMSITDFDSIIELPFENEKFCALANYEFLLASEYGDYMELPKAEDRVSNHDTLVYWK